MTPALSVWRGSGKHSRAVRPDQPDLLGLGMPDWRLMQPPLVERRVWTRRSWSAAAGSHRAAGRETTPRRVPARPP